MRTALIAALVSGADSTQRSRARRFVQGLSADELQFIAGFMGACVLDSSGNSCASRAQWAERIARYQEICAAHPEFGSQDQEHKMIVLLEYLCHSGARHFRLSASA